MNSQIAIESLDKALKNASLILQHGGDITRFRVGLCIAKVANATQISETHGEQTASLLFNEFFDRVRSIARTRDQVIELDSIHTAIVFKGEISKQELLRASQRLATIFEDPITIMADQIKADITTGLAIADEPSISSNTLFDTALNEISIDDNEQNQTSIGVDWAIKTNLEEAVNTGEFVVYYEPRIAPAFDHVVGATAHLRWHASHQRILLPHEFFETAAQSGLLEPIIHGMIKTSFSQVSRWKGELNLALSIPLGLFSDDTLMLLLKDLLAVFDLPAERIILSLGDEELDEDDYQFSAAQEIIAGIRAMGFKISAHVQPDTTLNTITLDEYRVDADLLIQSDSHVADLVAKAKNERAKVLVHKVANQRDVDYFKKIGVDTLQGVFYSPPIPQPEFRTWLTRKTGA